MLRASNFEQTLQTPTSEELKNEVDNLVDNFHYKRTLAMGIVANKYGHRTDYLYKKLQGSKKTKLPAGDILVAELDEIMKTCNNKTEAVAKLAEQSKTTAPTLYRHIRPFAVRKSGKLPPREELQIEIESHTPKFGGCRTQTIKYVASLYGCGANTIYNAIREKPKVKIPRPSPEVILEEINNHPSIKISRCEAVRAVAEKYGLGMSHLYKICSTAR